MKKCILILMILCLLPGLSACGRDSSYEKPVSGKYYLALLPDKKGKNTVENVLDVTLRLKVGGALVHTAFGQEESGTWEAGTREITLTWGDESYTGKLSEDRIEIGEAVYIRGLKEARDLWTADAAAYVADPLAEYEGKYYLSGLLEGGQNRVEKINDITLWLLPENEAILFDKGKNTLLSWNADGNRIVLREGNDTQIFTYKNGTLSGNTEDTEVFWCRDKEEAESFLAAHPYVPKPHIPVLSGLEGDYYLAAATAFGRAVDIGRAGAIRISLLPDWGLYYDGQIYAEEGSYGPLPGGDYEFVTASGRFTGSAENGCLTLKDPGGDQMIFFDSLEKAEIYRTEHGGADGPGTQEDPKESTEDPTLEIEDPDWESSLAEIPAEPEDAEFWQGTWFGLVRLTDDCSGLYRLMRGKCYTVYVTLSMQPDGTGTLIAFDPAATFAERLLSGSVVCEEGRTLLLAEGLIEPFNVTIKNFSASFDEARGLVSFSLKQSVSGGAIGGELLLRPWGEGWEDQPEILALFPDYEAYLEEVAAGVPRYAPESVGPEPSTK